MILKNQTNMSILTQQISSVFKPYLTVKNVYKGGLKITPRQPGEKVYNLASNEHPFGTSSKVVQAIKDAAQNLHLYPDATDIRLREALSLKFEDQLSPDQILCANSGSEILDLTFRAFLKEGDEIIVSSPFFLQYSTFSAWKGVKTIDVPLKGSKYELDVEGVLNAISDRTRIIALTSPNNPTGTIIPKDKLEALLSAIPDDILIVYDEVYRHFVDDPNYQTGLPYIQQGKNILALNSFSKTFGMAAMRLGYAYTTPEIAAYIRQIIKPFSIPTISISAGLAALNDQDFVDDTVSLILKERAYLQESFREIGLSFTPSQANFILVDPPNGDQAFVDHLIQYGIMTRPVTSFGAPGKVRITIGTREANDALIEALKRL